MLASYEPSKWLSSSVVKDEMRSDLFGTSAATHVSKALCRSSGFSALRFGLNLDQRFQCSFATRSMHELFNIPCLPWNSCRILLNCILGPELGT